MIDVTPDRPSPLPVSRYGTASSRLAGRQWAQRFDAELAAATRCRSVGSTSRTAAGLLPEARTDQRHALPVGDERPGLRKLPAGPPDRALPPGTIRQVGVAAGRAAASGRPRVLPAAGGCPARAHGCGASLVDGAGRCGGGGAIRRFHSVFRPFQVTVFVHDGVARAWVRDSRLNGASAMAVADALGDALRRDGIELVGVVVNGVRLERVPGTTTVPGDIDIQGRVAWLA